MKPANSLFSSLGTTIFETMSRLAQEHGAVNLGQGFPEDLEPPAVLEAASRHVLQGPHQYPSMMGIPALRQAVAARKCALLRAGGRLADRGDGDIRRDGGAGRLLVWLDRAR